MQEVHHDGSVGKVLTADRLEDLIPMINESLANPRVKYVKIFNNGKKKQAEEERTTNKEEMDKLLVDASVKALAKDVLGGKEVTRTFPSKRK